MITVPTKPTMKINTIGSEDLQQRVLYAHAAFI